jgi:hypothetical protein
MQSKVLNQNIKDLIRVLLVCGIFSTCYYVNLQLSLQNFINRFLMILDNLTSM